MAICENCGRKLEEGEVCDCTDKNKGAVKLEKNEKTEKNAQFEEMSAKVKEETGKAVGNIITLVKAVIASPSEAVEEYVLGQDRKSAYQLIAVEAIGIALANVLYTIMRALFKNYKFSISNILNLLVEHIITVPVVIAVGALLITFMADKYGNTKIDFNKGLAIASLQAIIAAPAYIVYYVISGLGVTILTSIASILLTAATGLALILTYFGFSVVVKDRKKLFYGIGVYIVVVRFVAYILGSIL